MVSRVAVSFLAAILWGGSAATKPLPEVSEYTDGMQHSEGFFDFYFDPATARVLLEISVFDRDLLYLTALPYGVGSNDIGLDRGQLNRSRVVRFLRSGARVLLVESNLRFRADSRDRAELAAVDQSFARSTLAGFQALARSGDSLLVDLSGLLLSDAHGVVARLAEVSEGSYAVDPQRSAPDPAGLKNFPRNTVLEAWVTFQGPDPGAQLRTVVPTPQALTVKMRHEFVALPEDGFEMRPYHPRSGFFAFSYLDYGAPLGEPIERRFIYRHRLRRAADGVVEPLIYYVDAGAPEPVRSALMEGASWWSDAFAAAGFQGVFQVRLLPADADPLDLRYNVIQWVHRSTRGWSYGSSVVDPRSGEILKGHVSLGSLRVRQDMLLAEGLTGPYPTGEEPAEAVADMALARLRQLAAHEVGHTLGLAHNFAASSSGDSSVMDYPHPFVRLDPGGQILLAGSYSAGMSAWDKLAIEYGYREFGSAQALTQGLDEILSRAAEQNLLFVSDPDARGAAAAHAGAHLWDNGVDPLARFVELMAIRERALARFSESVLSSGEPLSNLERKLVPIYLLHRYQAEALAKQLAGVHYRYAQRGDDAAAVVPVAGDRQRLALRHLVESLEPERLRIPAALLSKLQPPAYGYARDREYFSHLSGDTFDAFAPARTAAQLIFSMVLEPRRAQRLLQQHVLIEGLPGLDEVLERLSESLLIEPMGERQSDEDSAIGREVAWILLREMQRLASAERVGDAVRATSLAHLATLQRRLRRGSAEARVMANAIERFLLKPDPEELPARYPIPPGSPI